MTNSFDDIVAGLLRSSETLLGSYGYAASKQDEPIGLDKYSSMFRVAWFLIYGSFVYFQYKIGMFENMDGSFFLLFSLGFGGLLLAWVVVKFSKSRKFFKPKPSIYQSAFVTDQRLVLFNNYNSRWLSLTPKEVDSIFLDYVRGGRAIKVVPVSGGEHYLVGSKDLTELLSLIRDQFLTAK